jgi:hypothetical protein
MKIPVSLLASAFVSFTLFLGQPAVSADAPDTKSGTRLAETVCGFGQALCKGACGESCYSAASGAQCFNGLVCGFGQGACGCQCYSPALGQTCNK